MVGELVMGRFRVLDRVGSGGMGTVYRAFDERLQRQVAVKEIAGADARRVLREAQAAARLNHPGIVDALRAGLRGWPGAAGQRAGRGRDARGAGSVRGPQRSRGRGVRRGHLRGADPRPRARGDPPRRQAPERDRARRRRRRPPGQADGLRDRVAGGRAGSDGDGRGGRDARLHGAGAGRGRAGRRAGRHLFARADAVRAVGGHESRGAGDARSHRAGRSASRFPRFASTARTSPSSSPPASTPACARSRSCAPRSPSSTAASRPRFRRLTASARFPRRAPASVASTAPAGCGSPSSWRSPHGAWRSPWWRRFSGARGSP